MPPGIIEGMRINLVTPFADKEKAKALGARWDSAQRLWYIVDIVDLTPFMRWIPDMNTATDSSLGEGGPAAPKPPKPPKASPKQPKAPASTQSSRVVPHCGCAVLPWEACVHTTVAGS